MVIGRKLRQEQFLEKLAWKGLLTAKIIREMGTTNNWQRGIRRKGLGKKENGEEIGERRDLFFCLSRFSSRPVPSPFLRLSGYKNTEDNLLRGAGFAD